MTAAERYLLALPRFADAGTVAYQPGLVRMEAMMEAMGHPHKAFASVHIAGTNGKGSTASMLAAIATAAGYRTGLHTSPHLFHLTERMRVDGQAAPADWLAEAVSTYTPLFDAIRPSFFEATVALSFRYFADTAVDLAVVEVGLGGRLDATNLLHPRLALITSIARDHTHLLGETLPEIAGEKAGIIKAGMPVLTHADQPEVLAVLQHVAQTRKAPLHVVQHETTWSLTEASLSGLTLRAETPVRVYENLQVGLTGQHQAKNAMLALRAAELLLDDVQKSPDSIYAGLKDITRRSGLRGRLEVLRTRPLVVADVSHNPASLGAALAFLKGKYSGRLFVLFGVLGDKDLPEMIRLLARANATVLPVPLPGERAVSPTELTALLIAQGVTVGDSGTVSEGFRRFRRLATTDDALLIAGSHQVVAQWAVADGP